MNEKNCLKCVHVRHVQPDPNVLQRIAVCTESPPVPVAMPRQGAMAITGMFPPVGPGMWCSRYQEAPPDNDGPKTGGVLV